MRSFSIVNVMSASSILLFLTAFIHSTTAFQSICKPTTTPNTRILTSLKATPEISEWKILRSGAVSGFVEKHPTIDDGDIITTSPLDEKVMLKENSVVATVSGSKYKLMLASAVQKRIMEKEVTRQLKLQQKEEARAQKEQSKGQKQANVAASKGQKAAPKAEPNKKASDAAPSGPPGVMFVPGTKLKISGPPILKNKYLIADKTQTSTSLKSQICTGCRIDSRGQPKEPVVTLKLSKSLDTMTRENENYNRVTFGLFPGSFVKKIDYAKDVDDSRFPDHAALVLERGSMDLKQYLATYATDGLTGKAMRDAAAAAGTCVQAMHSSGMVWTDLKCENFVVVGVKDVAQGDDAITNSGLRGVKAIDLESARPTRSNPVDYSPEACPPEFAEAFLTGYGEEFVLQESYDMWSLGMMMYELSTGTGYFGSKNPTLITKTLMNEAFLPNIEDVQDEKLRALIGKCLNRNPKKRPGITEFLLHPYFITSGIGPISF